MSDPAILYEDDVLLAVDKPAGLPCHATPDPRRDHLEAAVRRLLGARGEAAPHLVLLHRLDVDTTGVVLFGRDPAQGRALADAFAGGAVDKTYVAVVEAAAPLPGDAWEVRDFLRPGVKGPDGVRRTAVVRSGGKPAHTAFRVLARGAGRALVEARPRTGRTHQIRVHLAEGGHPIVGDVRYGASPGLPARPLLHAAGVALVHPVTGQPLAIESPWPADLMAAAPRG